MFAANGRRAWRYSVRWSSARAGPYSYRAMARRAGRDYVVGPDCRDPAARSRTAAPPNGRTPPLGASNRARGNAASAEIMLTHESFHALTAHAPATRDWCVEAWLPDHEAFGYSRAEADELVRMAGALWDRYTFVGLTIDSPDPTPTALAPCEVFMEAIWEAAMLELLNERSSTCARQGRFEVEWSPALRR